MPDEVNEPRRTEIEPGLLRLLCDQGRYEEAERLVDRYVARIDHEVEQAAARVAALGDERRRSR